ncbi:MAG: hypothetical protein RLZZ494_131 [Pseudomonadota bacterium]|jgi:hypothetical protein
MPTTAFSPASLDLLPGECEHPPLRLLEPMRRPAPLRLPRIRPTPGTPASSALRALGLGLLDIVKLGRSKRVG